MLRAEKNIMAPTISAQARVSRLALVSNWRRLVVQALFAVAYIKAGTPFFLLQQSRHMGNLAVVPSQDLYVGVQHYTPLHIVGVDQPLLPDLDLVGGGFGQ